MSGNQNRGQQLAGIAVNNATPRTYPGLTLYTGHVAEGQMGYRGVNLEELEAKELVGTNYLRGYRSFGKGNMGPEKHSRGSTMFSAAPHDAEELKRQGYTHQIAVDISGLPYRTLRKPEGGVVHADMGLGLGVVGEMRWDRIHHLFDHEGKEVHPSEGWGNIGTDIKAGGFEETGRRTRPNVR